MAKKNVKVVIGDKTYTCVNLIPILDFLKIIDEYFGAIDVYKNVPGLTMPKELHPWMPGSLKHKVWYEKYNNYCIYTNALSYHCGKTKYANKCMYIPLVMLSWDDFLMCKEIIRKRLGWMWVDYSRKHIKVKDYTNIFKNLKYSLNDIYIKQRYDKQFIIKRKG